MFSAGSIDGTFNNTVRVRAIMNGDIAYDYATVVINPIYIQATLDRVEILPSSISLSPYQSFDFDALAYDTNDNPMFSNISYTWSVVSGSGDINQNGLFEASGSTGNTTIQVRAYSAGISKYDTANISISGGTSSGSLSYVNIDPRIVYLDEGETVDFDAQAYDNYGNEVSASYTWYVEDDDAGTITQSGYFRASYDTGTYYNAVKVRAYRNGVSRYDYADVIVRDDYYYDDDDDDDYNYYDIDADLDVIDENGGYTYPGDILLYTLTVKNVDHNKLYNVTADFNLPEYTTFISASSAAGGAGIDGSRVYWYADNLKYGETKELQIRVRVDSDVPNSRIISAKAYIDSDSIDNGFWVYANSLTISGGSTTTPVQPLLPTGAFEWLLAAISALLATVLTRRLFRTRELVKSQAIN